METSQLLSKRYDRVTHHLFEEANHNIGVYECCAVSNEGFGDIRHDAGVVSRQTFCSIDLYKETSPGPLRGKAFW